MRAGGSEDELPGDLWAYPRQCAESRLRFAMFAVDAAVGDERAVELDGATVVVTLTAPRWAILTLGLWSLYHRRQAMDRILESVPVLCGWCPKVRFQ